MSATLPGLLLACGFVLTGAAFAQTSAQFASVPPLITQSAPPNVMLVLSDDHELYKKAYSDFSDIDGDGLVDGGYNDTFTYSGYFNSGFCYNYDAADARYEPAAASAGSNGHSCNTVDGDWSGNFLNWASMTRIDIVRDVLFGGLRIVDTATAGATAGVTVLERAYLPEDVHSFVKVFAGATQNFTPFNQAAISICSTTFGASTNAPVLRVANGQWPLWASSEVVQCHYRSEQDSGLANQPANADRPTTFSYNARVQVCVAGLDAASNQCKPYSTNAGIITYKPIGLLQQYGDTGAISFGLLSGSYSRKIQGGVLRKDIVPLTGNTAASQNEINLANGVFINQGATDAGIINTISRFRIVNWNYSSNVYSDCSTYGISKSTFMTSAAADRQCLNWGNPLSEIYLEALRYFMGDQVAGATSNQGLPSAAFNTADSSIIPSLPQLAWKDPLGTDNACASCSIIVLSTGLNSFDKDGLGSVTDLGLSAAQLNGLVNKVGDLEGITGGSYLIGDNGTLNNESCTAKTIPLLSAARGICPEIGGLEGGFDIAGLSFHAFTQDLRADLGGVQNVNTYSVALAENLPSYELDVNSKRVTFVPICQAHGTGSTKLDQSGFTNCSFVDARIESQTAHGGRIYIAWEDSLWGNDFDMDAVSRIEWCIGTDTTLCPGAAPNADYGSGYAFADFAWKTTGLTANSIQFRTSSPLANAGVAIRLGFTISGVAEAGAVTRITNTPGTALSTAPTTSGGKNIARGNQGNGEQMFLLREGGYTISRLVNNSGNRIIYHEPLVYTADSTVRAGKLLENPLYFTAKYGSFNDLDEDGTPRYQNSSSDHREWDTRSINGQEVPDGIPDNFFPITNPNQLDESLSQIFNVIAARVSSGTAAAVVSNSSNGLGAMYQAYYNPQYTDGNGTGITWGGVLHSLFLDGSGRFREDNGIAGKLEDTSIDYVVDFFYDTSVKPNRTRYKRYVQTGNTLAQVAGGAGDLEDFGSIWNARDVLADISQANLLQQRSVDTGSRRFTEDAGSKRYIFTYLDRLASGTKGVVDAGEVTDFTHANFDAVGNAANSRYLGLANPADAANLVKYVRGQDIAGWRSRLVDIPGDGTSALKYWILGDIVHSSPLVVSAPEMRYHTRNGDDTYAAFREKYQRRRQMVYAGGNDGMLHAFNAGVWDPAAKEFRTSNYNPATRAYDLGQSHELGAEMWAYVPMNLLPHLQWLKEVNYPHVYFVDAPSQAFDVNIFANDAVHPNGWGTILVAGMRLGGGAMMVDLDGDNAKETTMHSSIIIMDITDPERPPTLLAEINTADLGYTTSLPALAKARIPGESGSYVNPDQNKWMLVFGSGPDDLDAVVSTNRDAKVFAYDLNERKIVTVNAAAQVPATDPSGFFGDMRAVDWNNDFADDAIFAGTVEGSEFAPAGRLKRLVLNKHSTSLGLADGSAKMADVINMGMPVSAAPTFQRSISKKENWMVFGTGRLFTIADNRSTSQQSLFGIKEPETYATMPPLLTTGALLDATAITVRTTGELLDTQSGSNQPVVRFGAELPTFNELYSYMDDKPGWTTRLRYNGGNAPSERVFNSPVIVNSSMLSTSYWPSPDLCTIEGEGFMYVLNFRTGTAEAFAPVGTTTGSSGAEAKKMDTFGTGAPSGINIAVLNEEDPRPENADPANPPEPGAPTSATPCKIAAIANLSTGTPESECYHPQSSDGGRMSWEQLAIPF